MLPADLFTPARLPLKKLRQISRTRSKILVIKKARERARLHDLRKKMPKAHQD